MVSLSIQPVIHQSSALLHMRTLALLETCWIYKSVVTTSLLPFMLIIYYNVNNMQNKQHALSLFNFTHCLSFKYAHTVSVPQLFKHYNKLQHAHVHTYTITHAEWTSSIWLMDWILWVPLQRKACVINGYLPNMTGPNIWELYQCCCMHTHPHPHFLSFTCKTLPCSFHAKHNCSFAYG